MKTNKNTKIILIIAGSLLFFGWTIWLYIHAYSFRFTVNSDNAYFVRAAEDILRGNYLLRGWRGGFFTALTGDIFWAAALRSFLSRKIVFYLIGPLAYALTGAAFFILGKNLSDGKKILPVLIFFPAIYFVPQTLRHSLMTIGMHGIAIAYIMCFFVTLHFQIERKRSGKWSVILFCFLIFWGCLADGFVIYFCALPILTALSFRMVAARFALADQKIRLNLFKIEDRLELSKQTRQEGFLFLATASGVILARIAQWALNRLNYLQTKTESAQLISLSDAGNYCLNTLRAWALMFGADFNKPWAEFPANFFQINGAIVAALTILLIIYGSKHFISSNIVFQSLYWALAFILGSFTFTTVTKAEPAIRYIAPAFFIGTLLASVQLSKLFSRSKLAGGLLLIPYLVFAIGNVEFAYFNSPQNNADFTEIDGVLKDRGVSRAYATYWEANALYYYSQGKIEVAPVAAKDGAVAPHLWGAKEDWYQADFAANCLMVSTNNPFGMTKEIILNTFGEADDFINYRDVDFYFYDRNLSEILAKK